MLFEKTYVYLNISFHQALGKVAAGVRNDPPQILRDNPHFPNPQTPK